MGTKWISHLVGNLVKPHNLQSGTPTIMKSIHVWKLPTQSIWETVRQSDAGHINVKLYNTKDHLYLDHILIISTLIGHTNSQCSVWAADKIRLRDRSENLTAVKYFKTHPDFAIPHKGTLRFCQYSEEGTQISPILWGGYTDFTYPRRWAPRFHLS